MTRTRGARNADHRERRAALIARLRARLWLAGPRPSWRDLAAAADVSLSTLAHHFGRRDDVIRAVMEEDLVNGAKHLAAMAEPGTDFASSIAGAVGHVADGFRYGGLGPLFAAGLAEGLFHPEIGPTFLKTALEPTIQAAEQRLQAHIERGEMRPVRPRGPAISLVAPVAVAFLHQNELGGEALRPLDLDAFLAEHVEAFVRAWRG